MLHVHSSFITKPPRPTQQSLWLHAGGVLRRGVQPDKVTPSRIGPRAFFFFPLITSCHFLTCHNASPASAAAGCHCRLARPVAAAALACCLTPYNIAAAAAWTRLLPCLPYTHSWNRSAWMGVSTSGRGCSALSAALSGRMPRRGLPASMALSRNFLHTAQTAERTRSNQIGTGLHNAGMDWQGCGAVSLQCVAKCGSAKVGEEGMC